MRLLNYLSMLFILVLFAGCTIDLRDDMPLIDFGEDMITPQIQDKIVEDVTPGREVVTPDETVKEEVVIEEPVEDEEVIVDTPEEKEDVVYISMSEVQQHNSFNDCWIILEGKVYDANILISTHPSGRMVINYCGRDATDFIKTQLFRGEVDFLKNAEQYLKQSYKGELR